MAKKSDIEAFDEIYEKATKPKTEVIIGIGAKSKAKNEENIEDEIPEETEEGQAEEEQELLDINSLVDIISNSNSFEEFKANILNKLGK